MADKQSTQGRQGSVARNAIIMVSAVVASRLLGMARDMVIAAQFGRTAHTDAYTAAFRIPDLLMYLVAGGAISSIFIPTFTEYLHNKDEKGAWETFSVVGTVMGLVATACIVVMEIFTPQLVRLLNPGYSASKIAETVPLTRILLPAQFCFIVGSLLMGSLNARDKMLVPALGPSIYNIGIIIGAVCAHPHASGPFGGLRALTWGAMGGAFVGNFLIQAIASSWSGMKYHFSLNVRHPGVQKVWAMFSEIMFGMALPNVDQIIMSFFASMLPNGGQTALTYANRTMLIPIGIIAQAMSIAVLPAMARQTAAGAMASYRATTSKTLRTILFMTAPASALMFVLALPIVQMLYQRHAFHFADALITAQALRFYCLGIFAWSCQAILTRGFYALHDAHTPVWTGRVMTVALIVMNLVVVHLAAGPGSMTSAIASDFSRGAVKAAFHEFAVASFGPGGHPLLAVEGIAFCTTVAATVYMIMLFVLLHRRVKDLEDKKLTIACVRIAIATFALCAVSSILQWAYREVFGTGAAHVLRHAIGELIFCGGFGLFAYLAVARYYRMKELADLERIATSKLGPLLRKLRLA